MHPLLRDINDMGEFRSEHRGNFTYRVTMLGAWWCSFCCWIMAAIMLYGLLHIVEQAKAKPKEIPPFFFEMIILCWVFLAFFVLFLIYMIWHNRKNHLFFALYEKGLLVIHRNRTIRRIFWDDIDEIRQLEMKPLFGLGKPVFQGIALHFRPGDLGTAVRPVRIRVEYFQEAEKLCKAIYEAKEAK